MHSETPGGGDQEQRSRRRSGPDTGARYAQSRRAGDIRQYRLSPRAAGRRAVPMRLGAPRRRAKRRRRHAVALAEAHGVTVERLQLEPLAVRRGRGEATRRHPAPTASRIVMHDRRSRRPGRRLGARRAATSSSTMRRYIARVSGSARSTPAGQRVSAGHAGLGLIRQVLLPERAHGCRSEISAGIAARPHAAQQGARPRGLRRRPSRRRRCGRAACGR